MKRLAMPPAASQLSQRAGAYWQARPKRERQAVAIGATLVLALLVWLVGVQPALNTVRSAPAQLDELDAQLQQLQRVAAESRGLRGAVPVSAGQSAMALKAATDRLGATGKLTVLGDRATLTLTGVSADALRAWLVEARSGARARPIEATLTRAAQGYSGTLVVQFGAAS